MREMSTQGWLLGNIRFGKWVVCDKLKMSFLDKFGQGLLVRRRTRKFGRLVHFEVKMRY